MIINKEEEEVYLPMQKRELQWQAASKG